MHAILSWIQHNPMISGFLIGVMAAGPFYLGLYSLLFVAKRSDDWIEKEYFRVHCNDKGIKLN